MVVHLADGVFGVRTARLEVPDRVLVDIRNGGLRRLLILLLLMLLWLVLLLILLRLVLLVLRGSRLRNIRLMRVAGLKTLQIRGRLAHLVLKRGILGGIF